jgi:hypothetical protein
VSKFNEEQAQASILEILREVQRDVTEAILCAANGPITDATGQEYTIHVEGEPLVVGNFVIFRIKTNEPTESANDTEGAFPNDPGPPGGP